MSPFLFVVILNAVICLVVVGVLLRRMPEDLKTLRHSIIKRLDGTVSSRRRRTERRAMFDFVANIVFGCVFFLTPLNAGIWYLHSNIVPIPMALEAVSLFSPSPRVWRERIDAKELGQRRAVWAGPDNGDVTRRIPETLFASSPILLLASTVGFGVCVTLFGKYYLLSIDRYGQAMHNRHLMYLEYDSQILQRDHSEDG